MSRNTIIANCKNYLGRPYVWGGESMEEGGYDCSGYAYRVLKDSGYPVCRTTAQGYSKLGVTVPYEKAEPGDLLFFGKSTSAITHIAIYAGAGTMYESIGGSKNTKYNPGKGVSYSKVSRRSDLILIKNIAGDPMPPAASSDPKPPTASDAPKPPAASGNTKPPTASGNTKPPTASGAPAVHYQVGQIYTLQAEMKVRQGPGTNYAAKTHQMLTQNGQQHDSDRDGALDRGTQVTCKEVQNVGDDIWLRIPSGWVAARYNGTVYVK